MSNGATSARDALDDKVNRLFAGKVVRKDLVRKVKVGANVPVFVLEFLLGKYCASSDEIAIQMGLQVVHDTLANNYIRSDESMKAQAKVKDRGRHTFIDKVKVRIVDSDYWAEVANFGHKNVHIPEHYVRDYERLVMGGVWAQVDMRFEYDEESRGKNPFWIDKLTPIQIATFDLEEYRRVRREFTTDEWLDLMLRSMGYEPGEMSRRLKMLFLVRLIPLAERNYNLVELGPRGTGKSYVVQEVSPYSALLTGGTTVANLFGHMSGRQKGMVQIWDVVGFDEVADLQKMPKEVITTMKTYCESGTFQRGQEAMTGDASIALFGNTNQPVDVMVQTGHLFAPMPDIIRDDMAFIDRLHFYLPGWEIPKMRNDFFTDHYGFVVDYLAEALREMRKHNFTEVIDRHFSMGAHLNARDRKAVRKTVSGLMKILFPHGEVSQDELAELLELALEGRRRVKEQLKKMGSFEYYHTSFSYTLQETGEEKFVGVPEQGGRDLISTDPLPPGTAYAAGVTADGTVGLYRVEVSVSTGTGKLKLAGGVAGAMKESVQRAFSYLQAKKSDLGVARDLDTSDLHVEVIDLLANRVDAEVGVAFFVACYSAMRKAPVSPALLVLGDMSVQGNIKPLRSLTEPLQVAKDNGAKRALIPIENKRNFLDVSADIMEHVDPVFFGDPKTAAMKVLGTT
ncbi:protease Lon-related BREX system protein BrxL [Polyangium jinanense]|uniref:protease Lon-related BREX system protein BrxL n=1 Tax=Polyangium jinanense TaxID=2829994 RepID=UPI002341BB40|nr:protease Lon-related BREX system protein BrxL [Polyangium jinanense]MDC3956921.1 protease Lon-related BREX system protein BrxL [Polyangium jinanense]